MPIANDMKNIAEGIEVSYGERAAFLSDLSRETHQTLKTFNREHRKMAADLGEFLTSNRDNRQKIVASLLGKNKRELKTMAEKLAGNLRESTAAIKKDTGELLSAFHASHQAMAKEQRNALSAQTKGRVEKVKEMLAAFDGEHKTRSNQLRRNLAGFQKQLETSVKEMRASVIKDLKETSRHWHNLAMTMFAKRTGRRGEPKQEIAEAKTTIADVFGAVKLKEQMLRMISAATSGLSLAQMAKALGIPYIRLAKPAMELVKQGEIEKRDSKYFEA